MMGMGGWTPESTSPDVVVCMDCAATFEGGRSAARRARWEPHSAKSQWALDHGPMVCPDCILALLDATLEAIKALPAKFWFDDVEDDES